MTFQDRFAPASKWESDLMAELDDRGWVTAPFGQAQIPAAIRDVLAQWQDQYGRPSLLRWAPDIIAANPSDGRVCLIDAKTDTSQTENYAVEIHAVDAGLAIIRSLHIPVFYVWNDGTLTPELVQNRWHKRMDGRGAGGSRTAFYLIHKSFAMHGLWGERRRAAS